MVDLTAVEGCQKCFNFVVILEVNVNFSTIDTLECKILSEIPEQTQTGFIKDNSQGHDVEQWELISKFTLWQNFDVHYRLCLATSNQFPPTRSSSQYIIFLEEFLFYRYASRYLQFLADNRCDSADITECQAGRTTVNFNYGTTIENRHDELEKDRKVCKFGVFIVSHLYKNPSIKFLTFELPNVLEVWIPSRLKFTHRISHLLLRIVKETYCDVPPQYVAPWNDSLQRNRYSCCLIQPNFENQLIISVNPFKTWFILFNFIDVCVKIVREVQA